MTTQPVSAYQGFNQPAQSPNKDLGQKDFLRLMVAQVQNQDPLQPQANGEFLAQLAQFSTNDGITKMQSSLQELASSLQSNQALQASALVGRKVLINNDKLSISDQSPDAKVTVEMFKGVTNLSASIYSESGELIKTIPLGQPEPGYFEFTWDGTQKSGERAPTGKYRVEVHGSYAGNEGALDTMTSSNVNSVSLGQNGEGLRLNVDGVGSVSLADVRRITL